LPVLRLLKAHLPESEIYWWVERRLAPLLENDPDLAGLVLFHRRRWKNPMNWGELWRSIRWAREQRFDWVIDLQGLARSALFAWLANGRLTVGLDTPRELARGFYDLTIRRESFDTHAVDWYLGVLPLLGVPVHSNFQWLQSKPQVARGLSVKWPVNGRPWVVLQPGARWPNKRWPLESFSALLRELLLREPRTGFVILGSEQDQEAGQALAQLDPNRCLNLTGKTSLPEMVEWIRLSSLMITNDTGPMHVAAALAKPIIALFGPTEPRRTGPYGKTGKVLQLDLPCAPCLKARCRNSRHLECLRALPPSAVLESITPQLQLKQ
jgi:heptosyltransferase I